MSVDVEKIIREYIPGVIHMSLATSKDSKPWVCEVHFAFDDDLNLYFSSKSTTRHCQELVANPQVAGNIVRQHQNDEPPLGVYFEGTAESLTFEAAEETAFPVLDKRFNIREKVTDKKSANDGWGFYKITVNNWYIFGRLERGAEGKKYHLKWQK